MLRKAIMSRFENSGQTSETQALAPVVFDKRFAGKVLPIIGEMIVNNARGGPVPVRECRDAL